MPVAVEGGAVLGVMDADQKQVWLCSPLHSHGYIEGNPALVPVQHTRQIFLIRQFALKAVLEALSRQLGLKRRHTD